MDVAAHNVPSGPMVDMTCEHNGYLVHPRIHTHTHTRPEPALITILTRPTTAFCSCVQVKSSKASLPLGYGEGRWQTQPLAARLRFAVGLAAPVRVDHCFLLALSSRSIFVHRVKSRTALERQSAAASPNMDACLSVLTTLDAQRSEHASGVSHALAHVACRCSRSRWQGWHQEADG